MKENSRYMPFFIMAALSTVLISRVRAKVSYTPSKYTELKKMSEEERGKNPEVTIMYSMSRQNNSIKKLWVHKPFFNRGDAGKYELADATKEVLFGELAVTLFGKTRAAKTKFSPHLRGVISRILGDDNSAVIDLLNFCKKEQSLPQEAQQTLLSTVIYSLIIEDRDLNLENIIFKSSDGEKSSVVYGIDHEFAGSVETADLIPLSETLIKIDNSPQQIIHLLFDKNFNWNFYPRTEDLSEKDLECYLNLLLNTVTNEDLINTLQYIVDALAFDDFKVCNDAKGKIKRSLLKNRHLYSTVEIDETVIPNMDAAIDVVKNNVATAKNFLDNRKRCKLKVM